MKFLNGIINETFMKLFYSINFKRICLVKWKKGKFNDFIAAIIHKAVREEFGN